MQRSPLQLRSRFKGESVSLSGSTDKKLVRSLSSLSDTTVITDLVGKHLSLDDIFGQLVVCITHELKGVVEEAMRAALSSVNDEVGRLLVGTFTASLEELDDRLQGCCENMEHGGEDRDTDRIVVDLCWDKLGVNLPASAISRLHRVSGQPKPGPDGRKRHSPIIVRLVSYQDQQTIYNNKKKQEYGHHRAERPDLAAVGGTGFETPGTQDGRAIMECRPISEIYSP
ncbi:hypothetical protein J6590_082901 [Homalodisca vitripennis]|nr:hypothetical protein J6590_082901 [Homalodisca vitripennis]